MTLPTKREAYERAKLREAESAGGNAVKESCPAEANCRGFRVADDNDADVLAILNVGVLGENGGKQGIGTSGMPDPAHAIRRERAAKKGGKPEAGKRRAPAQASLLGGAA